MPIANLGGFQRGFCEGGISITHPEMTPIIDYAQELIQQKLEGVSASAIFGKFLPNATGPYGS